ncbi:MAG: HEAT repeat domain-containing protein [Bryobacteraceae bacterium]
MNCETARKSLLLLLYGELAFDDEERLHLHLEGCESCRAELARERRFHGACDKRELEPPSDLLLQSRLALRQRLSDAREERSRHNVWDFFQIRWAPSYLLRPVGALALVAAGFFGARMTGGGSGPFRTASLLPEPAASRVRYVVPEASGEVQIVVDETRQRVVSGHLDDERIRRLLLAAAKDPADPGLRVESVDILRASSQSEDVRAALLYALQHDSNAGVRLKALDGLRPYADKADVRKALTHALLADDNPGLRTEAIDLLTQSKEQQPLVGVLQELLRKEDNTYVRLRCKKVLQQMNASLEMY